ncbi:MAG: tyrosine-type recombinase/integrase [Pseudonocardiaceae bacterium]
MGHVQDLWYKPAPDPATGRMIRVKTRLHGTGRRYRVRYTDPDGREHSKSFPDRCKKDADGFLSDIESAKRSGDYLDPKAGRISFESYAEAWLASQTFDESSRENVAIRLRKHTYPRLGQLPLASITPTQIRTWDRELQERGLAARYRQGIFTYVEAVLSAAVDDGRIRTNPCKARSVSRPRVPPRKIKPWSAERVRAVHDALPDRYKVALMLGAGLGLRQGETFGLAVDDVDFVRQVVHVTRQVKIVGSRRCFGPPKGGEPRQVPLPESVALVLAEHIRCFPPVAVTLPWQSPRGERVSARLLVRAASRTAVHRVDFNRRVWGPALRTAGITAAARVDGFHALRHFYASTLLDSGESIVALAEYLGHADPAFTLRTYTHLMPSSRQRTRHAIDTTLRPATPHDTETA